MKGLWDRMESWIYLDCSMYRRLGNSGLKVSNVCLGTLSFGTDERPGNCTESEAHAILDRFVELGGNFIDTADKYCKGETEQILGTWLKKMGSKRDELVIATKVRSFNGREGPINGACLSRKHLVHEVEESLKRLQTDYIDLYQMHIWDRTTPLEESLRTMDDLIRAGKIRYFGVSNFCGWQLQKVADYCKFMGLTPCVSLQQQYSLLNRELELEMTDVCENENISVLTWSPLKGGWLTGQFNRTQTSPTEGTRVHYSTMKGLGHTQSHPDWETYANDRVWNLLDNMRSIGEGHGKTVAQVALRWLLQKKVVASVVIGCDTVAHLEENMGASDGWELSDVEMGKLDDSSSRDIPYPYSMIDRLNQIPYKLL